MSKISLYYHTVKSMKPSQVYFRLRKMAGMRCSLRCGVREFESADIQAIPALIELDYDEEFIERFSADEIMKDRISFLHSSRIFHWDEMWECPEQTSLWNFNLHYFEYLFALIDAYRNTGNIAYFEKSRQCITSWIRWNPVQNGGSGWSPYTIALRLTVWLDYYAIMEPEIKRDREFQDQFLRSMYEQYVFLSNHLEKDLLGNHYFEDLKTLILCSLFFHDDQYLECVLKEFKSQCKEQILEDGMHFELSPMYHKIILEDMLRVAWGLRIVKKPDQEIEGYLQPMLDVSFSLEEGLERVPLFNDSGNNVSKSLKALMRTAQYRFHIVPHYKTRFPVSGYYIFKQNEWKLIVDAGQPGPTYIPGHAHCDAMSFELFKNGKPAIVNCGTYAYQCEEREFFRSTAAHNTVMVKGVEQSQCWGTFRLAKRSNVRVLSVTDRSIQMELEDQSGNRIRRTINLDYEKFLFEDRTEGKCLTSFVHSMFPVETTEDGSSLYIINIGKCQAKGNLLLENQMYAPDFGVQREIPVIEISGNDRTQFCVYM